MPAGVKLRGRQGCSLAARTAGRNSIEQEMTGTPAARGAGGQLGGIVAIEYYNNIMSRIFR